MLSVHANNANLIHESALVDLLSTQANNGNIPARKALCSMAARATKDMDIDKFNYLIRSGVEIGYEVVQPAMKSDRDHGSDCLIKYLLSAGMDINVHLDKMGTPILYALAMHLPDEYVSFLLDQGADPDADVLNGDLTGLEVAVMCAPDLVAKFLAHGAQAQGTRALVMAAQQGKIDVVRVLVPHFQINEFVDDSVYHGRGNEIAFGTALHHAVSKGHLETARVLLDAGADASIRDSLGDSAVALAKEKGFDDIVRLIDDKCSLVLGALEEDRSQTG